MSKNNKYKGLAVSEELKKSGRGKAKLNNRHGYGNGNGKFGKKADRIRIM